ncbi:MAG: hypothetical protein ACLT8H_02525 [Streptococcus parasanguinis]
MGKLMLEKLIEAAWLQVCLLWYRNVWKHLFGSFLPNNQNIPEKIADEDNYVLSCASCNAIKRDISPINEDGKTIILFPYSENYKNEIQS